MEPMDVCTIKPDEKLTKEKALEIKQRIDGMQNDLDFLCDWLKYDLKLASAMNSSVASVVHGEAYWAWNQLQTVYRFLAKVIGNAEE